LRLWDQVIERFADRVIVMPGWNYSGGCAAEVHRAFARGLRVETLDGKEIDLSAAVTLLSAGARELARQSAPINEVTQVADQLKLLLADKQYPCSEPTNPSRSVLLKDEALDRLAETMNVAQFVSFCPVTGKSPLMQRYARVLGHPPNVPFSDHSSAFAALLERSVEGSINLRSFAPGDAQSREFIYGLKSLDNAIAAAERLASEGLWVIANETVDVRDGGVSGVLLGDVIEFAPDDTPRCVERPGVASLPREQGRAILATVYGFAPDFEVPRASRLEFSLHPKPQGWRHTHTLGWEYEAVDPLGLTASSIWPNKFSRMLGDKVFGLLVAHHNGLPVPRTTVINRRVATFIFGQPTGSAEVWLRTSPSEQEPGRFTTTKGWIDPFRLLSEEDPAGTMIASVLCQTAVPACHSGAAIVTATGNLIIEGRAGEGEALMKGEALPETLPAEVIKDIQALYERAHKQLGPVRFEWVHDGKMAWIVQLHRGLTQSEANVIVPGEALVWLPFAVDRGLADLRKILQSLDQNTGIILQGRVGLTSHLADVIRRKGVPARINPA
jgi:hypothetical protein